MARTVKCVKLGREAEGLDFPPYPGPIGKIISPHMLGLEATKTMATASSLCGACATLVAELLARFLLHRSP